jgi:hypothetical protein
MKQTPWRAETLRVEIVKSGRTSLAREIDRKL